jgi:hypothetical protein
VDIGNKADEGAALCVPQRDAPGLDADFVVFDGTSAALVTGAAVPTFRRTIDDAERGERERKEARAAGTGGALGAGDMDSR